MPTLDLNQIELVASLRTAPLNGARSSGDFNQLQKELLADQAALAGFINSTLVPMLSALPDGAALGLEGATLFADSSDTTQLFYDSIAGKSLTVAESLKVVAGIVTGFQTKIDDVQALVATLRSKLAATDKNDLSIALRNLTNQVGQMSTSQVAHDAQIEVLQGTFSKTQTVRVASGIVNPNTTTIVSIAWPTPMSDTNYTVSLELQDENGTFEILGFFHDQPGISIAARVRNNSVDTAASCLIHATSTHD
jgi:hypothetical protein